MGGGNRPFSCLHLTLGGNNRRNNNGRYMGQKVILLADVESNFEITIFEVRYNPFNSSSFNSVAGLLLSKYQTAYNNMNYSILQI